MEPLAFCLLILLDHKLINSIILPIHFRCVYKWSLFYYCNFISVKGESLSMFRLMQLVTMTHVNTISSMGREHMMHTLLIQHSKINTMLKVILCAYHKYHCYHHHCLYHHSYRCSHYCYHRFNIIILKITIFYSKKYF